MERQDISKKEDFKKVCRYLEEVLEFIKEFAQSISVRVTYTTTIHDWPTIEICLKRKLDKEKSYYINKSIFLMISDYKFPPIYEVWVGVSNNYGFKEIFEIIHSLVNKEKFLYKRLSWRKNIGYLDAPIDKLLLKDLLNQAKHSLDNFDESKL